MNTLPLVVPNTTLAVSAKGPGLAILHSKLYLSQTNHIYRQSGPKSHQRRVKPGEITVVSCSSDFPSSNK